MVSTAVVSATVLSQPTNCPDTGYFVPPAGVKKLQNVQPHRYAAESRFGVGSRNLSDPPSHSASRMSHFLLGSHARTLAAGVMHWDRRRAPGELYSLPARQMIVVS